MTDTREASERFDCFGSSCEAFVSGDGPERSASEAIELVRRRLQTWHEGFSRFSPDSELSMLNADPRWEVPVSLLMARLAQTVRVAATLTGGLVDATLVDQIRAAGYDADLGEPVPLADALALAPPRSPASAGSAASWQSIEVNLPRRVVTRPPGVKLDSGGLAKGLFADVLAAQLADHDAFAVNCAGDLALAARERSRGRSTWRARSTGARCTPSSCGAAAWRRAASGVAAGWTSTVVLRIICSTRTPAGRLSPASCR